MNGSVALALVLGVLAGFLAGLGYFGSLAWTARRLVGASRPAGVMLASLLVRMALLAAALVILARLSPWALVAAVPGVVAARSILLRRFGAAPGAGNADGSPGTAGGASMPERGGANREIPDQEVSEREAPEHG